jgi:ferredoxin-type protein NapF
MSLFKSDTGSRMRNPGRRDFLSGHFRTATNKPAAIRPPWASEISIAEACTGCGACRDACPEQIIVTSDDATPRVDFSAGECSFCGDCAAVCPEPVFTETDATPWHLSLTIAESCLATSGVYCRSCGDACAPRAITFQPEVGGKARILFSQSDCSGCGACVSVCPVNAVSLAPLEIHPGDEIA